MEKIFRTFNVDYHLSWGYGVEISQIRADLDAIEALGATHVEITSDIEYDSVYLSITPVSNRLETDEEFSERVAKEKSRLLEKEIRELAELERLKAKYEFKQ